MNSDINQLTVGDANPSWGDGLSPIYRHSETEAIQLSNVFDCKKSRSGETGQQEM